MIDAQQSPTPVDVSTAGPLAAWLMQQGLQGATQEAVIEGFCHRLVEMGIPLWRLHVAQSTFHPQYGGMGVEWTEEAGLSVQRWEHTATPRIEWLTSPLYHLIATPVMEVRERLSRDQPDSRFPLLNELRMMGATDYFATAIVLDTPESTETMDPNNTPEGVLISFSSFAPGGFSDAHLDQIRSVLPYLGLALKSASNRRIAQELLRVYLGQDAGNRVLSGEIRRGSLQTINAVICYFDLSGFTSLAERTPGDDLIAMLNDYFGLAVGVIHDHGGHILKFMGDGMLSMFDEPDLPGASVAALQAAVTLRRQLEAKNATRAQHNLPLTGSTVALHAGEILYGNIGAENRLDFTVIGPAVNLTARLSGMHGPVGQDVIVSEQVVRHVTASDHGLISIGRYMLRGVSEPQELYTIHDPG